MRRTILFLLSIFILMSAAVAGTTRAPRRNTKQRTTKSTKKKKSSAPVIRVNTDSINAARLEQSRRDSLDALMAQVAAGDVSAINDLGMWYYTGHIVDQDYGRAVELWRQASDIQSPRAMANLGKCYELGHGVPCDSMQAARMYVESIKCGNGALFKQILDSADTNMFDALIGAYCYENGEGVRPDLARAADLYAKAAEMGAPDGICGAALCYIAVGDTVTARQYLDRGARLGNPRCEYWSGVLALDNPQTATTPVSESVALVLKAAEAGVPEALDYVGELYATGLYVDRDPAKAMQLFKSAAEHGIPSALWHLGDAYTTDMATRVDFDQAIYLMSQAIAAGYDSTLPLGEVSAFGDYVRGMQALLIDQDYALATQCFKAAEKVSKSGNGRVMEAVTLADPSNPKANPAKAVKTLEKLAPNTPQAAYWLSEIYDAGKGVPTDKAKASFYRKMASDLGYVIDIQVITDALSH